MAAGAAGLAALVASMNCTAAQQIPNREGLKAVAELRSTHRRWQELIDAHPAWSSYRALPNGGCPDDLLDHPCSHCDAIETAQHAFFDACNAFPTAALVQPITWRQLKGCFFDRIVDEDLQWRRQQTGWQ